VIFLRVETFNLLEWKRIVLKNLQSYFNIFFVQHVRQSTCCVMLRVNNASGKKVRILSGKSPRSDDVGKEYEVCLCFYDLTSKTIQCLSIFTDCGLISLCKKNWSRLKILCLASLAKECLLLH